MVQPVSNTMARFVETDVSTRIFRVSTGINEAISTAANEPSLGMYRLQEHVLSSVPKLVNERQTMEDICERVKGVNFDMEYDMEAVRSMTKITTFKNVLSNLHKAIEMRQLLIKREMEQKMQAQQQHLPPPRPNYGSIESSPTILRRDNYNTSINNPTPTETIRDFSSFSGVNIEPKKF